MTEYLDLGEVGRLPAPLDNTAIAVRKLEAGLGLRYAGQKFTLSHSVLEGHRFAVRHIATGEPLLSWGLPFGVALRDIAPGEYVANAKMLPVLRQRNVGFEIPDYPNFADQKLEPYQLDEQNLVPGDPLPPSDQQLYFDGYRRPGARGVGTRNYIVILGATSHASSYARALEERLRRAHVPYGNVDGIVAVAHTEGGGPEAPNNLDLLLRTLAGFVVHPNVGAVLVANGGSAAVSNDMLLAFMQERGYPLRDVLHEFLTIGGDWERNLHRGEEIVRGWLPEVGRSAPTREPASNLKIALQCGGSDAFSGVSGNPLAASVAREIIRAGGSANLAETDELIGAEQYVLSNVRDLETAKRFLSSVESFKELVGRHGHTAEDNPSGGNNFRGLYNITIKSIGAAMKRDPQVRLDYVLDYAEPMQDSGFYFMNSPGNDLESIAGQVASGCNVIFFVTGNGSITNFPFVPTLKVVTTTRRYELLSEEMDVNAGAYLDGATFEDLTEDMLGLTLAVASGQRSAGERAGHSQVSIWRNWARATDGYAREAESSAELVGIPVPIKTSAATGATFNAILTDEGPVTDQIGLVLPTSLCSGQIARMVVERLNARQIGGGKVSRFVALPHTEGCGVSAGSAEELYTRTLLGYLQHPIVGQALLLEHGCEKTHNDYLRSRLQAQGVDPSRFGWASVQLDGGISKVMTRVEDWFSAHLATAPQPETSRADLGYLRLGLSSVGSVSSAVAASFARLTSAAVGAGGTVVVPKNATLLKSDAYRDALFNGEQPHITLAYGQRAATAGYHIMETPTDHWVETVTGLGATGVEIMLVYSSRTPLQAHRMVPVLQVTDGLTDTIGEGAGFDVVLAADPDAWEEELLDKVVQVASREYVPTLFRQGNTDFQFTRGLLGVSM